jgi:leader peptidase (prepilin peptidase)/N-methyltransferase
MTLTEVQFLPLTPLAPDRLLTLMAGLLGACVGSFLNVVTWRLPRQESILWPGSHCPKCGTTLRWLDNLPLLSWLLLRGRCHHCRAAISVRYPLVELLTAGLWVAAMQAATHNLPAAMGPSANPLLLALAGCLLLSWLVPLVLIDMDQLWLPETLCRYGLILGLSTTALLGFGQGAAFGRELLADHLLAAGLALLGFEALSAIGALIVGKPALGLGDAKLAALIGAWLGLGGLGICLSLAVTFGAVVGSAGRLSGLMPRHQPLAFGPFLAAAAALVWSVGNAPWLGLLAMAGWPAGR